MVAPATGGGNEEVSIIIKLDAAAAKKALEEIVKSENNVAEKTESLKNLMIGLAIVTNKSIETSAAVLKKWDDAFAGTTKSIINNAAKLAKVQLLPSLGPTPATGQSVGVDIEEEARIAQTTARIRMETAQAERQFEQARHQEAMKDAELEQKQAQAAAVARVNAALEAQAANQKVVTSIQSIINADTSTETKVQQLKNLILNMAQESGRSIESVVAEIKKMDTAFAGTSKSVVDLAGKAAKQQLFPTAEAANFTSVLEKLGTAGQFFFGTVLGLSAVTALRSIVNVFKEATQAALEFSQAQVELQIGARAVQRMGNDTTIQEYYKEIADIQKKYPIFSKEQAIQAYSNALILARGLNLTKEQFQQLIDVSASASIVMGRDFGETATGITKSLSSGWFEAAQRAGFLISRQSVINEGVRIGIENAKRGYNAMTEIERAQAALSVYVRENGSIQEDVNVVMESQAGKVKVASAEWSNLKLAVGQFFTTIGVGTGAVEWVTKFFQSWSDAFGSAGWAVAGIKAFVTTLKEFLALLFVPRHEGVPLFQDIKKAIYDIQHFSFGDELAKNLANEVKKAELVPMMGNVGKDAGAALGKGVEDGAQEALAKAFQKLRYNIQDELTNLTNRIAQLQVDLNRKLADLAADYGREVVAANEKYANDVAETNISFNNRRAESERKYRLNEIDEEAKFQEQMRQLRSKFLFDLEDALRERDARQVLRLIRQYQMDKENTTKEADLARAERKRQHAEELAQLEAQRAERLRILDEEHQAELAKLYQNWIQKQADARLRYEQEKADTETRTQERIKQMTLDFQREYNLTDRQAKALVALLDGYFGTSGPVAAIYKNLINYIMYLVAIAQTGLAALAGFGYQAPNTIPGAGTTTPPPTHAKGGTFLATKPTLAIYGEAGPEMATFTPLGKGSSGMNGAFSGVEKPMPEMGGMLRLMLTLSPDLRTEILNESMYNISTVIEEVNRER